MNTSTESLNNGTYADSSFARPRGVYFWRNFVDIRFSLCVYPIVFGLHDGSINISFMGSIYALMMEV